MLINIMYHANTSKIQFTRKVINHESDKNGAFVMQTPTINYDAKIEGPAVSGT